MSNEEQRFVVKDETFNDTAVRELAKTKALLAVLVQFKRITKEQMQSLSEYKRLQNCENNMNDYDRLRLNSYTREYHNEYTKNPWALYGHKEYKRRFYGMFVIGLIFLIALWLIPALLSEW